MNLWYSTLASKFLDAVNKLGFATNPDPDGGVDAGVENIARSVNNADGTREYSASSYLGQAQHRSNLYVLTGAQVTKVVFGQKTGKAIVAKGVQFVANGQTHTVSVGKEVILSAGMQSTKLVLQFHCAYSLPLPKVLSRHRRFLSFQELET